MGWLVSLQRCSKSGALGIVQRRRQSPRRSAVALVTGTSCRYDVHQQHVMTKAIPTIAGRADSPQHIKSPGSEHGGLSS